MKILIAPDKFKGSLTSFEACQAIGKGIRAVDPGIETSMMPFADGGDGFAAVMKHYLSTKTITCETLDPLHRPIHAGYELNGSSDTAIIELAAASGLVLLKNEERNALQTSTIGCGMMIVDAIKKGVQKIILGLGGSATTDAGAGILYALGFQFFDDAGLPLRPCGGNLIHISRIMAPAPIPGVSFEIACDVQNLLYGPRGAAFVYAPQKGASPDEVRLLDKGLRHFAAILRKQQNIDISEVPGTGAAGGIAASLLAFFECRLTSGVKLVMQASRIEAELEHTDFLITGEGKLDAQTSDGKVVSELARLASRNNIPVVAFCGIAELAPADTTSLHLQSIEVITPQEMSLADAIKNAGSLLTDKTSEWLQKSNKLTP